MMLASDVTVRFGERVALSIRRLEVERGEAIGVRGANGCGKTTLLRVLAGFLAPTSGRTDVPRPGRTVLLHQRPHLFIGTAHDNVEFALVAQRVPRRERAARVGEALDRLGATPFASRTAADLSGGERRRVAVARALVVRPELLLLDEPLEALDEPGRLAVIAAITASGATRVVASPDPILALSERWITLESMKPEVA